ncbi:MAG: 4Fe-4S dicluster domain-containing protein, partial [Elusimicrobiota bacterium]
YLNPEGIVGQIYSRCIGCRYCVNACPYTCKFFNWSAPEWPESMTRGFNPDVPTREKGVVEKCLFCDHRLERERESARAEGREVDPARYRTACQEACPTQAIIFGDLNDPESAVAKTASRRDARVLLEELKTEPKVFYLGET